jgi:hypothetical protein
MATNSDINHAKNVTNFETLISVVVSLGATYNPSKDSLKLPALQTLHSAATDSMTALKNAESATATAVDTRELAFKSIGSLFTRINNALKASNSTVQADDTAKSIFRKLHGKRASAKLTEEQKAILLAEGKEVNQNSNSQMGYDDRVENFESLISFLQTVPEYNPNEEELKITTLQALLSDLKAKNISVMQNRIAEDTVRGVRKSVQNTPLTGLVDIANDVKSYIKSVFGVNSTQYKLVSKLRFVKFK